MTKGKVAIVNRTNLKNYGSVLQVYALCQAVKKLGFDSEVIWQTGNMSKNWDIRPNKVIKTGLKLLLNPSLLWSTVKTIRSVNSTVIDPVKGKLFDDFVSKFIVRSFYAPSEIKKVASSNEYYKFICGSDQVWVTTTLYPDPMMYLRFAPRNKRIAYAPSLGRDYIPRYNRRTIRRYIDEIDHVSVREMTGRELIKELTGRDVPVVADPTLLIRSMEWDSVKSDIGLPNHYVLCYFLTEPSDKVKTSISRLVRENKKKLVILGHLSEIDLPESIVLRPDAGPGEFLSYTSNADLVITDSYHGMLFSLIFHRNFWSVERNYGQFDQSSRQLTVLSMLNLTDRYIKNNYHFTEDQIDYVDVQSRIDVFVKLSTDYLKDSLR